MPFLFRKLGAKESLRNQDKSKSFSHFFLLLSIFISLYFIFYGFNKWGVKVGGTSNRKGFVRKPKRLPTQLFLLFIYFLYFHFWYITDKKTNALNW